MPQISLESLAESLAMDVNELRRKAGGLITKKDDREVVDEAELVKVLLSSERARAESAARRASELEIEKNTLERMLKSKDGGSADRFIAIAGLAVAALALAVAYWQLEETTSALRAANQYQVQSDVLDTLFGSEPTQVLQALDARIAIARDFYEAKALSDANWSRLLCQVCSERDVTKPHPDLKATIGICQTYKRLWSDTSCLK
jgi:hypothetical protein